MSSASTYLLSTHPSPSVDANVSSNQGNFVFIPMTMSLDGSVTFMDYKSYCTGVFSAIIGNNVFFTTLDPLPFNDSSIKVIGMVPNQNDFITNNNGGNVVTKNNLFSSPCSNNFSIYDLTSGNMYMNIDGGLKASQEVKNENEAFLPLMALNDNIVVVPYR